METETKEQDIDKSNRVLLMIKRGLPEKTIASMAHVSLDYVDSVMRYYVERL